MWWCFRSANPPSYDEHINNCPLVVVFGLFNHQRICDSTAIQQTLSSLSQDTNVDLYVKEILRHVSGFVKLHPKACFKGNSGPKRVKAMLETTRNYHAMVHYIIDRHNMAVNLKVKEHALSLEVRLIVPAPR